MEWILQNSYIKALSHSRSCFTGYHHCCDDLLHSVWALAPTTASHQWQKVQQHSLCCDIALFKNTSKEFLDWCEIELGRLLTPVPFLSGIVSLVSLSLLSFERYLVVLCSIKSDSSQYRRARLSVAVSWLYSLVWTLPPLLGWSRSVLLWY